MITIDMFLRSFGNNNAEKLIYTCSLELWVRIEDYHS